MHAEGEGRHVKTVVIYAYSLLTRRTPRTNELRCVERYNGSWRMLAGDLPAQSGCDSNLNEDDTFSCKFFVTPLAPPTAVANDRARPRTPLHRGRA